MLKILNDVINPRIQQEKFFDIFKTFKTFYRRIYDALSELKFDWDSCKRKLTIPLNFFKKKKNKKNNLNGKLISERVNENSKLLCSG